MDKPYILVLYYSKKGTTRALAYAIAQGIEDQGMQAKIRTVPDVVTEVTDPKPFIPETGDLYCTQEDLIGCAGLAMGSPTYFGNMAAPLKLFWDNTVSIWMAGDLQGKPACTFTTSGSLHGGQETTLFSMMLPLWHHGMILMGLPYSNEELNTTTRGGTPYGATHVSGAKADEPLSLEERTLAVAQGKRLAQFSQRLLVNS